VKKIVHEVGGVTLSDIKRESTAADLKLDSAAVGRVFAACGKRFGIEINPTEDAKRFVGKTIGDLIDFIEKRVSV